MADYLSREEILRVFDNLTVKTPMISINMVCKMLLIVLSPK